VMRNAIKNLLALAVLISSWREQGMDAGQLTHQVLMPSTASLSFVLSGPSQPSSSEPEVSYGHRLRQRGLRAQPWPDRCEEFG